MYWNGNKYHFYTYPWYLLKKKTKRKTNLLLNRQFDKKCRFPLGVHPANKSFNHRSNSISM